MKKRSKKFYLLILLLCSISLSGCGDGCDSGGSTVDQTTIEKAILSECGKNAKGGCYGSMEFGYSGGLCQGDPYMRWIEPTSGTPGAIYAEAMTETLCKDLKGHWYSAETLTKKGSSPDADSSFISTACSATVSSSLAGLAAHVPIITYRGADYWADLKYNLNDSTLSLLAFGSVSDLSPYRNCKTSTLSDDGLKLHVPTVIFNDISYWATLQYNGAYFVPIEGGKN